MTQLKRYSLDQLQAHPWQVNIPDITGKEWDEFLADINERGVQDPITVSMRTGTPVIVDGHQRVRAARECGYDSLDALEKPFASEDEEIEQLFSSAVLRRHLTPQQMAILGEAYEKVFAPEAELNVGGRPSKQQPEGLQAIFEEAVQEKPQENFPEVSAQDRQTRAKVASKLGISDRQYDKIKTVHTKAPEPVKEAWGREEISTHAAHTLTKSPEPIQQALNEGKVNIPQAIALEKNKDIRKQIEDGKVTIEEGVKLSEAIKRETERIDRETNRAEALEVSKVYRAIIDLGVDGLRAGHDSLYNQQHLKNGLWDDYLEVMSILRKFGDIKAVKDKEFTVDALRVN